MNRMNAAAGFTLVELLVTVTVVSILASMSVLQFHEYRKKAYDVAALSDLHNTRVLMESVIIEGDLTVLSDDSCIESGSNAGDQPECRNLLGEYGFIGLSPNSYMGLFVRGPFTYVIDTAAYHTGSEEATGSEVCYRFFSNAGVVAIPLFENCI